MCGKDTVSLGNGAASACLVGAGETNFTGWSGGGGVDGDLRDRVMLTRMQTTPMPRVSGPHPSLQNSTWKWGVASGPGRCHRNA